MSNLTMTMCLLAALAGAFDMNRSYKKRLAKRLQTRVAIYHDGKYYYVIKEKDSIAEFLKERI